MAEGTSGAEPQRSPGEIARAVHSGVPQAESWLIERFQRPIRILLRNWGHPPVEADDLTQETLMAVLRRLRDRPLDNPDSLSAFVQTTARHLGANFARLQRRRREILERDYPAEPSEVPAQPEQLIDQLGLNKLVTEALDQIRADRDRIVLVELYVRGTSKAELCKRLKLSPTHFDRVLYNARNRLRIELQKLGVIWP